MPDAGLNLTDFNRNEYFFGGFWCSCETCAREYNCEHVVAVRIYLRQVTLPVKYAEWGKKGKRGRGRPKKATGPGMLYGPAFSDSDDDEGVVDEGRGGGRGGL